MSLSIDIKVEGVDRVSRSMTALTNHMSKDLRPFFKIVQNWWYSFQDEAFANEGPPVEDSGWAELSPKYAKWKAKRAPGAPILTLTGKLRDAMAGSKRQGAWEQLKSRWMKLGISGIPYWATHNFGRKPIPQRRFLNITREMMADLDRRVGAELARIKRIMLAELGGPGGLAR
jgi:phage gpG-like protein